MKTTLTALALSGLITLPALANTQPTNEEARSIAQQFGGELKPALQNSMKNGGGPVPSIAFCHSKAPQIAYELAQKTGWKINRVSLKPRGATATADNWETTVLERFNAKLAAGTTVKGMEFSEIVTENGVQEFRYMKAIATGNVCLKCHGTDIAAPITGAIHKLYPNDKATGYVKGEIRGAFSSSKAL